MSEFVEIRRRLHQIPEPGFEEFKTQALLLEYIGGLPQERLEVKTWRTGILVRVKGLIGERCLGYRADMDGLPIDEETSYEFRSTHPGYMHACGHDLHMAIGLGVLTEIVREPINDDVLFVFQPAEEGPGGALPMLSSEEFKAWKPDFMMGLHIAPEYPVGTIATKPGILFANTSELFIDLTGIGGHAAYPHRAIDMIVATSSLVMQMQSIVSRNVDPLDSVVVTLGKITGGTKQNIIAERVRLEGTIRSLSADSMADVKARIEALLTGVEAGFNCKTELDYGSNYYQVYNHEEEAERFMNFVQHVEGVELIECTEAMTGEDFGYFLRDIPGLMFWLGVDTPYGLHHAKLEPQEEAIGVAINVVSNYLRHRSS
ncbi:amidohydrolase [Paenibacillus sp. TCA20]|uniref:N-acetyldiaminopimelate deacetylase n=1 Tax=Paenibacillus urinalis TaxID=521520 RepID=A0AAX3N226_9BACL|nr:MULTISPECIES: N-acetyldiaminopimelate deacetylase [Paenibacillus]WDH83401.1 N-acetyldiaminopimelate deacetylase [Paenibacillus urinalis]GAK41777.1 amidohydrolase [Paenibacillus sp. TCA20]